jgi:nucleotide-binding universal stress UspA family protein
MHYLSHVARRIEKAYSLHVIPTLIEADDIWDSLSYISNVSADLVVMATHGRGRIGSWFWDSAANRLINRAAVPHLLVKGDDTQIDFTMSPTLKHVLVPLDGSRAAEGALSKAAALADVSNSVCTLLRVVPTEGTPSGGTDTADSRAATAFDFAVASRYLETAARSLIEYEGTISASVIGMEKSIAATILAQSEKLDVDLVALTSRPRSSLARLLRPSMAERLLHKGSVPVLVCPPNAQA